MSVSVRKEFAYRLKDLRMEKGLTLKQLSEHIGVSFNTISRWEREERVPNIENIVALAEFFKVSADYLCGFED